MPKKEESTGSLLGLAPLAKSSNGTYGLAVSTSNPLTKTEEKIAVEKHKQEFVIRAEAEKTAYAAQQTAEIRNSAGDAFYQIAEHQSSLNQAARGKDFEPYVQEFNHHNIQGGARNLYNLAEAGGAQLADIAGKPLYRDDEPERKPNVIQRILGG